MSFSISILEFTIITPSQIRKFVSLDKEYIFMNLVLNP